MKTLKKRQRLGSVEAYACACIAACCTCTCTCHCDCSYPALHDSNEDAEWQDGWDGVGEHSYALIHELTDNKVG